MNASTLELDQISGLFQALSDETRLRIVLMLARGERCVCDLQEPVGAYQSRLSFHLRKLKDAGVVSDRKEGRWVYYTLQPEALEAMRWFLAGVVGDTDVGVPEAAVRDGAGRAGAVADVRVADDAACGVLGDWSADGESCCG